jgi:hypothetical protein
MASASDCSNYLCAWLVEREQRYGGLHTHIHRSKVSPHDPRTPEQLARGGMWGGDRMRYHNYAPAYAQAIAEKYMAAVAPEILREFAPVDADVLPDASAEITVVELGILRGVGLAIWCDLFPHARVIGLEIDLSHFRKNDPALRKRAAFQHNSPEVHEYDELAPDNASRLKEILRGAQIDICIDDALHYDAAILKAMQELMPLMRSGGAYFVEDNFGVHGKIRRAYPGPCVSLKEMTVIWC